MSFDSECSQLLSSQSHTRTVTILQCEGEVPGWRKSQKIRRPHTTRTPVPSPKYIGALCQTPSKRRTDGRPSLRWNLTHRRAWFGREYQQVWKFEARFSGFCSPYAWLCHSPGSIRIWLKKINIQLTKEKYKSYGLSCPHSKMKLIKTVSQLFHSIVEIFLKNGKSRLPELMEFRLEIQSSCFCA